MKKRRMPTGWYPASILPLAERKGKYEVRDDPEAKRIHCRLSVARFHYWDGKTWLLYKGGPESVMGRSKHHQWRGLEAPRKRKPVLYYVQRVGGYCGLVRDREKTIKEEGSANIASITVATKEQIDWVRSMGGHIPGEES